jgi:hypothetical protein
MDQEKLLQAEENIMDQVCGLCHWPYVYRDEKTMYAEKCDYCPAAAAVKLALQSLAKEAAQHE